MKLQDFLIGLGVFALFTVIIFGAINTNDSNGIYSEKYLNITHDAKTGKAIGNISSVGHSVDNDFRGISGNIKNFSSGAEETTESSLVGSSLRVLINIPTSYKPVANMLRMMGEHFDVPQQFLDWVISSVIIIIVLILIAAFVKNPFKS